MNRNNFNIGFTLLEVLIALSIIGIAMLAVIKTTEATTRNLQRVQDRTAAEWVAQNALVAMKLKLDGLNPIAGRWQSNTPMMGRIWHWQASSNTTVDPTIVQIYVEVFDKEGGSTIASALTYWPTTELTK